MTRWAVVDLGVATDAEIDSLKNTLTLAKNQQFRGPVGRVVIRVIAQVP